MSLRSQKIALAIAVLVISIFIASFAVGIRGRRADPDHLPAAYSLPGSERIRIEVLNGAGDAGLAREATERLRDLGFDVVYFGNDREFGRDSSVVLDRVRRIEAARPVADALGITNLRSEPDSTLLLEVTVILGKDWPAATPKR